VPPGYGMDIKECERLVILVDFMGGNLAFDDPSKNRLLHIFSIAQMTPLGVEGEIWYNGLRYTERCRSG
jgi:hypothetical protein